MSQQKQEKSSFLSSFHLSMFRNPMSENAEDPHGGDVAGDGALPLGGLLEVLPPRGVRWIAGSGRRHGERHRGAGGARPLKNIFG